MKNSLLLLTLLVGVTACAPRVAVDKANVDFSKYRTYAWMNSSIKGSNNPVYYNQLATQQVEETVSKELSKKGLKEATRRPDLLLGYHFFIEEKTRTVSTGNNYGPYGAFRPYMGWGRWGYAGWGPGWNNFGGPQYTQEKYEAGTVVVDMVDVRTKRLVWRGAVQNALGNPTRISQNLTKQVERIVEQFPQIRG